MRLIRSLPPNQTPTVPTALVIGNFDGCHLGHQALIERMHSLANSEQLAPALMCFEPLPATFFRPDEPVRRLMSVRDKISTLRRLGIEYLFMLPFQAALSQMEPEAFVSEILVAGAHARHIIVGEDFRFGHRASGDVALLQALGRQHGFEVHSVSAVRVFGERVSSTRIREVLAKGDLETAEAFLGRPYSLSGRVLRGQQLGRQLGYATTNLRPPNPPALSGIFAVRVCAETSDDPKHHPGVASLGQRPTVNGRDWLLEVHLFDYDGHLYGQHLTVEFIGFIRSEEKFESLEAMTEEMHRDAHKAREVLSGALRFKEEMR